jgi:hypothetical protein
MKYKITAQYAKDEEKPLAAFCEYNDANFFLERKFLADEERGLILIYRLFENQKLLKEFNKEKITSRINAAQYAEGDRDLPDPLGPYKISKDNLTAHALASFTNLKDAELYIEDKLTHTKEITTYYIFDKEVLITQMNQRIKKQSIPDESTQGKGQTASFRPTPLNTSPRPPGTPPMWIKDDKEDE